MVKKNDDLVWPEFSYFEQQACDFHLETESMPNIAFFYLNWGYLSYKDNRKIYYGNYYILSQIVECANPPDTITKYVFKD